jgi:hypothetical protein
VFPIEHRDHNAQEPRDLWHTIIITETSARRNASRITP